MHECSSVILPQVRKAIEHSWTIQHRLLRRFYQNLILPPVIFTENLYSVKIFHSEKYICGKTCQNNFIFPQNTCDSTPKNLME